MQISFTPQVNNFNFQSILIPQEETQNIISKSLNNKQLETMLDIFEKESNNPVNAIIYTNNGRLLRAKLSCKYKLKNFKENIKQIPLVESKLAFIKRIGNIIHKYNESLCKKQ